MSGPFPRGVPWINWDEWLRVMNGLFSNSTDSDCDVQLQQTIALQTISVWRARGKLPHAIDSTAQLINITRKDAAANDQDIEFRSLYSFAIIRAINGLVDQLQTQYYADSIYNLANKIDLPGWLVEIRHDATHNDLPSILVLRSASAKMITWFYEHYWCPQLNHIQSLTKSLLESQLIEDKGLRSGSSEKSFYEQNLSHSLVTHLLLPLVVDTTLSESFSSLANNSVRTPLTVDSASKSTSNELSMSILGPWGTMIDRMLQFYPYLIDWIICHVLHALQLNITAIDLTGASTRNTEKIVLQLKAFKNWLSRLLKRFPSTTISTKSTESSNSLVLTPSYIPSCLVILSDLSSNLSANDSSNNNKASSSCIKSKIFDEINDELKLCIDKLTTHCNIVNETQRKSQSQISQLASLNTVNIILDHDITLKSPTINKRNNNKRKQEDEPMYSATKCSTLENGVCNKDNNNTNDMQAIVPNEYEHFSLPTTWKVIKSPPISPIGFVPFNLENSQLLTLKKVDNLS